MAWDAAKRKPFYLIGESLSRGTAYLLILPALAFLVLFFFSPSFFNIWLSFHEISLFQLNKGGSWVGLKNYIELFNDPQFRLSLFNTVVWLTGATVIIRLVLGLGLAMLANASVIRRFKLSAVVRSLLLIPWTTPPVVAVAAWQWLLHPRFGAINQVLYELGLISDGIPFLVQTSTVWVAIIMILVWREVPFVAISILAGLQAIPQELYEAATVDGATGIQIFWRITLPLLQPVISIVSLLITIWTFNNFIYVWLSTRGGPGNFTQVLATEMYTEAFTNYRLGYGATVGVFMTIIMGVFAVIYFKTIFKRSMEVQ